MIEFDGISFNDLISRRIMAELAGHDPSYAELAQDQVPNRVTRYSFMATIAKINGVERPLRLRMRGEPGDERDAAPLVGLDEIEHQVRTAPSGPRGTPRPSRSSRAW